MSAVVEQNDKLRQLDRPPATDEQVREQDIDDKPRIARLLQRILKDLAGLRRRWTPQFVDHRDRVVDATGTALHRFPHNFNTTLVNYWAIRWTGATAPCLRPDASSDKDTLVLTSTVAGTITLRVEIAG